MFYMKIDYQILMGAWLSKNYKLIANKIYSYYLKNTSFSPKSKVFSSAINAGLSIESHDEKLIKKTIRARLHNKTKYKSKFTIEELQDICEISGITPNELFEIKLNKCRLYPQIILSEKNILEIKKNFRTILGDNKEIILPCAYCALTNSTIHVKVERHPNRSLSSIFKNENDYVETKYILDGDNNGESQITGYQEAISTFHLLILNKIKTKQPPHIKQLLLVNGLYDDIKQLEARIDYLSSSLDDYNIENDSEIKNSEFNKNENKAYYN